MPPAAPIPTNKGSAAAAASSTNSKPPSPIKKYFPPSSSDTTSTPLGPQLFPSSKLKLLHQRTSLSVAYDNDSGKGWGYRGETSLYVIVDNKELTTGTGTGTGTAGTGNKKSGGASASTDTTASGGNAGPSSGAGGGVKGIITRHLGGKDGKRPIELGLHLRDGCVVNSVQIFGCCAANKSKSLSKTTATGSNATSQNDDVAMKDDADDNKNSKSKEEGEEAQLHPLPQHTVSFAHHDPLSIVMRRPATLHSVEDDGIVGKNITGDNANLTNDPQGNEQGRRESPLKKKDNGNTNEGNKKNTTTATTPRYEADAHATRGTKGMTYSIRAASISSALGELRVYITPTITTPTKSSRRISLKVGASSSSTTSTTEAAKTKAGDNIPSLEPVQSEIEAMECWKHDLLLNSSQQASSTATATSSCTVGAGERHPGSILQKVNTDMVKHRCHSKREARLELIAKSLAEATTATSNTTRKGEGNNNKDNTNAAPTTWRVSPAMKIVIQFSLRPINSSDTVVPNRLNLGGIHFIAPTSSSSSLKCNLSPSLSTPHIHTIAGAHGDHQGVRSWLPTLDSASPNHRASHELCIKMTCRKEEGLWPCAAGEDFGYNRSVSHPILGGMGGGDTNGNGGEEEGDIFGPLMKKGGVEGEDEIMYQQSVQEAQRVWNAVEAGVASSVGRDHAQFINNFFNGEGGGGPTAASKQQQLEHHAPVVPFSELNQQMLSQLRNAQPTYVTSIYTSLIWSPCPSRSLGFAIGPFSTLYDPEYFRLDVDEDDEDSDAEMEDGGNGIDGGGRGGGGSLLLQDTVKRLGEGIRQLYFCPKEDREWIHENVTDDYIFGKSPSRHHIQHLERPELTAAQMQDRKLLEGSILASTIGVPNRALSLMRDVLAMPAYHTSSYTQIWIPNAHMSGSSSGGNMTGSPEVCGCNSFLGGSIMDSTLLPPPGMRLPYYDAGRTLQFLQARNAIRGWVRAAIPLGAQDDVGQGYLHTLIETFIMSLYERGHGAFGEGGGKGSFFYTKRYAIGSGLNSPNLDFLPLVNIEDDEADGGPHVAVEERGNEHLWRSASNGTETHTSSLDEFVIGQLQAKDFIEALERSRKDHATKSPVPLPSMGWKGSHQSATFLSHNSASSSSLGCGALDFVHPMGGQLYRAVKTILLSRVYEGRSGVTRFTRVVRAAFIASFLRDMGLSELQLPEQAEEKVGGQGQQQQDKDTAIVSRPPFVICVDEIVKKRAISHAIFTRALRVVSGPIHEAYLRGNLVDIGRENYDSRYERRLVAPEGFPNSYVRGASGLYLRVGVHIEAAEGSTGQAATAASQNAAAARGIHLHVVAEPVIPEGGSAFGGPVTLRVIENEGQCREFIKTVPEDGSRVEWSSIFLHARPVSTVKQQQAASGISDAPSTAGAGSAAAGGSGEVAGSTNPGGAAFTSDHLHRGGYQALELIRITNITPLLWVRVDPHGLYNGRLNIFQQDACLAEQLFHDGDAVGQVEAMRALAERPLKIQGTPKINNVHDVPISELPVRVLGDCLRGSVALHCDLPHNPAVRTQAALAIAQWQNNKAPESRDVVGRSAWLGLNLLLQYFKERYYCNGAVIPTNFRRCVLHKHIAGGASGGDTTSDGGYQYLDALTEKDDRKNAIEFADEVEIEEDEEYRVRSACITAIASIRARDGMTPKAVVEFLEEVLLSGDKAAVGSLLLPHEEEQMKKKQDQALDDEVPHSRRIISPNDDDVSNLPYVSFSLVADALLALCYIQVRPQSDFDPTTGRQINSKMDHPILPLMKLCLGWLDWDLERLRIRAESNKVNHTGVGDSCYTTIAPCAITALCHMALLKQSTTFKLAAENGGAAPMDTVNGSDVSGKRKLGNSEIDMTTTAQFYVDIFDEHLTRADAICAAAAQSVVCICCAADRDEALKKEPLGLLVSLEFLLDRILEPMASPGLRLTLALLMMDACTGKICSLQRAGSFCGQNRLCGSGTRLMNGPLGASCGGDNGSALLMTVSEETYPAANSVNDGARRGLKIFQKDNKYGSQTALRVSKFATRLWRSINGESVPPKQGVGLCSHDTNLRCALVSLWQWIWPQQCWQVLKTQPFHAMEGTPQYHSMGLKDVMKTTKEEKEAAELENQALAPLMQVVEAEVDRQKWRGEMAGEAYKYFKNSKDNINLSEADQPLPVVVKDQAWNLGGWVASTAQQRRAQGADGGSAVRAIRLMVKSTSTVADNP